ncbi:hypothetical protein SESBI_34030 [Sesbania bispinosa]|nr:hypothetical protein SESBI_34030 [Sesbania bispinosa]
MGALSLLGLHLPIGTLLRWVSLPLSRTRGCLISSQCNVAGRITLTTFSSTSGSKDQGQDPLSLESLQRALGGYAGKENLHNATFSADWNGEGDVHGSGCICSGLDDLELLDCLGRAKSSKVNDTTILVRK